MTATTPLAIYERKGHVAYVTMNRPEAMNALGVELVNGLHEAFVAFRDDRELFVSILTGAGGRAFSAGADLKEATARRAALDRGEQWPQSAASIPTLIRDLSIDKPIIAAVDGFALAGGCELALQCDIRIATTQSEFGFPNPRRSLLAPIDLTETIPRGEAMYMLLTGSHVSAEVALRNGFIHSVHPDRESLMQEADRIADEILQCAPLAVQGIKALVRMQDELPPEQLGVAASDIQSRVSQSEDAREGPRAFAEKRKPEWKAR